ncbi:hypothetical protein [Candidatus Manganitrophus noduliformans]|uniref:Uncharacterized protein n=1 Tax=Candidatus Manganitrophus noduliformans TaxID=2606439 RepID=A0A7X6DTE1_9BACT|nr:hypothetical protein [Candidatus Manganitrophus noduliformans]NKE72829.1 hypothetical protein [Candidatus Manganitrophus noduliformans]
MEDRSREQNEPMTQPRRAGKTRRWPRTIGITGLIASHLAFFLPLRAFVPVAPESDPWWGIGLVLVDEILFVMVIHAGIKKWMRTGIQKGEK